MCSPVDCVNSYLVVSWLLVILPHLSFLITCLFCSLFILFVLCWLFSPSPHLTVELKKKKISFLSLKDQQPPLLIGFGPSTIWHGRYKKIMYFSVFSLFFSPFDFNSSFEQFDHALVIKAQLYRQNIYVNHTEEQSVCRCLIRCTLGAVTFISP